MDRSGKRFDWVDEDGCYDSWDEDEDEWFCEDIDNQEECLAVGCEWEYSNNMPEGGSCFGDAEEEDENWDDECREFESEDECLAAGCEWDDEDG